MSYSKDREGPAKVYKAASSTRTAPGGVCIVFLFLQICMDIENQLYVNCHYKLDKVGMVYLPYVILKRKILCTYMFIS